MEIWKDIEQHKGKYQISNLGRVRNKKLKILKLTKKKWSNYYEIRFHLEKEYVYNMHRLVAQAFLGLNIRDRKMYVCHKDDNGFNNNVTNLFLGSAKDNTHDMMKKGRLKVPTVESKKKIKDHMIDDITKMRIEGMKLKDIGIIYNVSPATIFLKVGYKFKKKSFKT